MANAINKYHMTIVESSGIISGGSLRGKRSAHRRWMKAENMAMAKAAAKAKAAAAAAAKIGVMAKWPANRRKYGININESS
jgi:hypothetical protein